MIKNITTTMSEHKRLVNEACANRYKGIASRWGAIQHNMRTIRAINSDIKDATKFVMEELGLEYSNISITRHEDAPATVTVMVSKGRSYYSFECKSESLPYLTTWMIGLRQADSAAANDEQRWHTDNSDYRQMIATVLDHLDNYFYYVRDAVTA